MLSLTKRFSLRTTLVLSILTCLVLGHNGCSGYESVSSTTGGSQSIPDPDPTPTPNPTPTPTPSPTPSPSPSPTMPPPTPTPTLPPPPPANVTSPRPFWRKPADGSPTFAPSWYANKGPVTREVFYDNAQTNVANGDRLEGILESLSPGDHVVIHAGSWLMTGGQLGISVVGTANDPVVVRGADGEAVKISRTENSQNLVDINRAEYMIIENLIFEGGSIGIRLISVNNFMFYENNVYGSESSAITANSANTSYLYFVDNEVHDASSHAEGFYLGGHTGTPVTHHSYVIGNYVHDMDGPDVDQGDGIEIKINSYANVVRYNFVRNTNYPGITIYATNRGTADRNIIEDNVVINSNDNAMQIAAEAIVRNNLVIGASGSAFASIPHATAVPKYLEVTNNTFINNGLVTRFSSWDSAPGMIFSNNILVSSSGSYMTGSVGGAQAVSNIQSQNLNSFVGISFDGSALDGRPKAGTNFCTAGSAALLTGTDIMGRNRTLPTVGAFVCQ